MQLPTLDITVSSARTHGSSIIIYMLLLLSRAEDELAPNLVL